MNLSYRVGTRKSPLALKQTQMIIESLQRLHPRDLRIQNPEILGILTTGDCIADKGLVDFGGKALFVKEIEQALLENRIDFGVHSLKDVEANLYPGFQLASVSEREIVNDVLIVKSAIGAVSINDLKQGAIIGTCSPRRRAQLLDLRPDLEIVPLTGNILTRLSKLEKNSLDAIILAFAGLKRLDLFERDGQLKGYPNLVGYSLSLESMVPAVGQGVLVTQTLVRDETITGFLKTINHKETEACITAERTLLKIMGGDCRTPIAAYCSRTSLSELHLRVFYKPSESEKPIRFELIGKLESPEELGARACQEIRKKI